MGCSFLLQGTFLIQGSKPALPHCRQRIYFSEGWKYSKADRGGGRTSRNVQPSRPPVLTRHTQDTLPLPSPSWTGGLGGEHAEGQKVKGSGEGGEARRNGKPGQSHRDLGSNASPAGYKLWDLSQLLSLPEPRFPRLLWEVIMRLEPVGVRSPPGRKESRGYFWVAAGDRACPQKSQAWCWQHGHTPGVRFPGSPASSMASGGSLAPCSLASVGLQRSVSKIP